MSFISWLSGSFSDSALTATLGRARLMIEEVQAKPIIDGILLQNISLTTGVTNNIQHKLSRQLVGYMITLRSADCRIWDEQLTSTEKGKFLKLQTSANVTVDIWVF